MSAARIDVDTVASAVFTRLASPVGELLLVGRQTTQRLALSGIYFAAAKHARFADLPNARDDGASFVDVVKQLGEYFEGRRTSFDVLLAPVGTLFQREVWQALRAIPYGETTTYAAIALHIRRPKAVRAVGAANGRNPLSIIVPCHRAVGSDGTLTGYAGGLAQKERLLELERHMV